ncbi:MAG: enoyl-CoA hydratase/isomerase family protein [Betaproteobacteria bacterium]
MSNDTPSVQELLVERDGHVMWLTLNRPTSLNSVNPPMLAALHHALDALQADGTIRVLVITGAGDSFCSGSDLGIVAGDDEANRDQLLDDFIADINRFLCRLERLQRPVIAALNGLALGAGLEIALCADFIVARADARVGDGHARYGLLPGGGASARLPRRIGAAASKWLSFTGDLVAAERLLDCGLIQCVFPPDEFRASVAHLSERIAGRSPLGLHRMKQLIDNSLHVSLENALANERAMLKLHRPSWDRAEGLAAFAAKRTPNFRGI